MELALSKDPISHVLAANYSDMYIVRFNEFLSQAVSFNQYYSSEGCPRYIADTSEQGSLGDIDVWSQIAKSNGIMTFASIGIADL